MGFQEWKGAGFKVEGTVSKLERGTVLKWDGTGFKSGFEKWEGTASAVPNSRKKGWALARGSGSRAQRLRSELHRCLGRLFPPLTPTFQTRNVDCRIWMPSSEVRDLRQLLLHRYKLVMIRARVKNELQHLCLNKGVQRKTRLWSKAGQQVLRELPLKPWASRRREDLLQLMAMLDQQIEPLDMAVKAEAQRDKMALLLQAQPGVGPITALAYVLTMGDVSRFPRGKQVASYLGLIPREHSSGGRQKLGAITKQGNRMLRMLLVEAAQTTVRLDPEFRKEYLHRCHQKPKAVAKVAAARKLAVRLYWMLRTQKPYPEVVCIESSPRVPLVARPGE